MTTYGPSFIVHSVVPLRDRLDAVLKQQMDLSQGRPDRAARLGYGDEGIKALFNGEELLERLKMKRKRADEKLQSFERGVSLCAARTADDDAARDVDDDSDEDAAAAAAARAADMVEALIKNRPDLVTLLYALGHKLRPSLRRAIEQACEGLGQVTHSQLAAQEAAGDSRELKNAQAEVTRLEEPLETTATARDGYRQSYEAEHGRLEASTDVVRTLRENETNLGARVEALKEQLQDAQRETANADRDVALLELQKADLEARLGNAVKDAETELRARSAGLEVQLTQMERQLRERNSELDEARRDWDSNKERLEQYNDSLRSDVVEYQGTLRGVMESLAAAHAETKAAHEQAREALHGRDRDVAAAQANAERQRLEKLSLAETSSQAVQNSLARPSAR